MLLGRLGLAIAAGLVGAVGCGFLLAAADMRLGAMFSPAVAAAILGAGLAVLAAILLWVGRRGRRARDLTPEDVALAALGLVARSVRTAPEKALIAALVAGVLSEWLGKVEKRKEEAANRRA
ncbi:MAG: hypothetical protein M0002_20625 [Rhodospirillales bacterium]|nr:hypothetical protein [Rhodospirillales bacterium]